MQPVWKDGECVSISESSAGCVRFVGSFWIEKINMEKDKFKDLFRQDAKTIVDAWFDAKIFRDEITRDDMNVIEDLLEYMLTTRFDSYVRLLELSNKIKKTQEAKK